MKHSGYCILFLLCGALAMGRTPRAQAATPAPGYTASTALAGLTQPACLAFAADSTLYVGTLDDRVLAARDLDGDGVYEITIEFAGGMSNPTGLLVLGDRVLVSFYGQVNAYRDTTGDYVADVVDTLLAGIPAGAGRNYGIALGPDGLVYLGVGAVSNLGVQAHPWSATILRFTPDGDSVEVYATGLRVTYDLAFHTSGALFAADNGPSADSTLCFEAPDELNWIRQGLDYGFPDCFGFGDCVDVSAICDPPPCGAGDCDLGGCDASVTYPIGLFDPHASADGLAFGDGSEGFATDALFVAEFGQTASSGGCPSDFGHRVSRVSVTWTGSAWTASSPEAFVTGLARPLDVAMGPDHALYVVDYGLGEVLRVAQAAPLHAPDPPPGPWVLEAYPNPTRSQVHLSLGGEVPPGIRIQVFDVAGRIVAELDANAAVPVWDLRSRGGSKTAPGVYFVRARTRSESRVQRLLVLP